MCPYWIARAISPPGRRARCQASVRRNLARPMTPQGSAGMAWSGIPCLVASRLAQAMKSSIRLFSPEFFRAPVYERLNAKLW